MRGHMMGQMTKQDNIETTHLHESRESREPQEPQERLLGDESPQLRRLRNALYREFRQKYEQTVTGMAYEIYVQGRPLMDSLGARQERKIQSFAERFAHAFNVVARTLVER